MVKVMLADSQKLFRESLKLVLENLGFDVVAAVSDGFEALRHLKAYKADVLLIDVVMPKGDGIEAIRSIRSQFPELKVVILTECLEDGTVFQAFQAAVSGYILKDTGTEDLKYTIETVCDGGAVIQPKVAAKLIGLFSRAMETHPVIEVPGDYVELLTQGEWRIINEVGRGLSNKEIAEDLRLSEGTVRNHLSVILDKLSLKNRTQLALWAFQYNIRQS